eukprot:Gb_05312 [translate_table: standard]
MLCLVDSDNPSIGFVHEGMERWKEVIARVFNNVIDDYKLIWNMVGYRWKTMHSPLHVATFYLDFSLFRLKRNGDKEIMSGLYATIEKLNLDREIAMKVRKQLIATTRSDIRECLTRIGRVALGVWWDFYGAEAPELQHFAIRVLSQGCGATTC